MNEPGKSKSYIILHIMEIFYSLGILSWYVLPYYFTEIVRIIPFDFPYLFYVRGGGLHMFLLAAVMTYVVPVICGLKLISIFFRKKISFLFNAEKLLPIIFNIILSGCIIFLLFFYIQTYAHNFKFFLTLSLYTYILLVISVIFNIF